MSIRIVNPSRDRLAEMEKVFCEALGVPPKGVGDDTLWTYFDADRSWLALDDDDRVAGLADGFGTRLALPGGRVVGGGGMPWVGVRVDRHGGGRSPMEHQVADAADRGDAFLALDSSQYSRLDGDGERLTVERTDEAPGVVVAHVPTRTPGR